MIRSAFAKNCKRETAQVLLDITSGEYKASSDTVGTWGEGGVAGAKLWRKEQAPGLSPLGLV